MRLKAQTDILLTFFAVLILFAGTSAFGSVAITTSGQASAVIMTRPSPSGMVTKAAQEFQKHIQLMSGVTLTISTVGNEGSFPGKNFIYIGQNTASDAAGVIATSLTKEYFKVKTISTDELHIVGRDSGTDDWKNLDGCQPGTMFGVYYALGDILGCRWTWPGDLGIYAPANTSVSFPDTDITTGPVMVERKYRIPRIGKCYLGGTSTYGFGIPILPTSSTRKQELADEEFLWHRRQQLGARQSTAFAHYYDDWWTTYGTSHPEYFATPATGYSQPWPNSSQTKQCVSLLGMQQARVAEWQGDGAGTNLNACPADSRGFCTCANCMAWDSPSQSASTVWNGSAAELGDRYARQYAAIAALADNINPNVMVYGYAYDVYQNAPHAFTGIPANVAIAYIPDCPSATDTAMITLNEDNVIGWMNAGCDHMYLRPNWMLGAHAGPYFPLTRCGTHYKDMAAIGDFFGFDSDSSTSSYAPFGAWYYMLARLMQDPTLTISELKTEYCSAFGSASSKVLDYLNYWENYINGVVDGGNLNIVAWSGCVPEYDNVYTTSAFDGAETILNQAYALLGSGETQAKARLDFLKVAIDHGRLTTAAIALVHATEPITSHPEAEAALRTLLAFRDSQAESWAIWREWFIDREQYVPNMKNYWSYVLSSTPTGESTANAFIESSGVVSMEAENYHVANAGTGACAGKTWQLNTTTSGDSGDCMQALTDTGVSDSTGITGPMLDFKMHIQTTGLYYVLVRMPSLGGGSNSVQVGQNGVCRATNMENTTGAWSWRRLISGSPVTVGVSAPGVYHFNVWMREDGVVIDKVVLTTNSSYAPVGTDLGPTESAKRPATEYALTVNSGSGDGQYGEYSIVPVHADAPQGGYQFNKWTGDTDHVANHLSADTTVTMPSHAATITASYTSTATYTLTVNSGTGDGTYSQGTVVSIAASAPPTGKVFSQWTGDVAYVANVNSANTTVTMPAQAVTVTATYVNVNYALTVNSGSGDGSYIYQQVVSIAADSPESGYVFSRWIGDTAGVADVNAANTTVTMPAAAVTVTATYVQSSGDTFIESSGMVVMESEHYSSKASGTGSYSGHNWTLNSSLSDDSGDSMESLPNSGLSAGDGSTAGPVMDFKINFGTTGVYYVLVRQPALLGSDNSINLGMDGTIFQNNFGHTAGEWRWSMAANSKTITTTGLHTFNVWMREDGYVIDKIILTTNSSYALSGTDLGPAESPRQGGATYSLAVNSGTGDGSYGQGTVVNIAADAPPTGKAFSAWTGDVAYVANVNAANTTVTMPAQAVTVTATYVNVNYTLTVTSGTGDGSYVYQQVVNIAADAPQGGYAFSHWTGDTATVANVNSSSTSITMPAANASVTATYAPTGGGLTFQESSGLVSMEAEHYSTKANGTGSYTSYYWSEVTPYASASNNSVMQGLPNNGIDTGSGTSGPVMNFQINFSTTGNYYVLVRFPPLASANNTVNVGMNGAVTTAGLTQNSTSKWKWVKAANSINVPATGSRTFNVWMREDGVIADKIVLTTNSSTSYDGGNTGPAESPRQ